MGFIKVYTREPIADRYPNSLANSVHFACKNNEEEYIPLYQEYGLLFAKAKIREDNTIEERGIANPSICFLKEKGKYLIVADVVDANGTDAYGGLKVIWETEDFISFEDQTESYEYIENCKNETEVPDNIVEALKKNGLPIRSVSAEVEEEVLLDALSDLNGIKATIHYSDGTTSLRPVKWNTDSMETLGNGKYKVSGEIIPTTTGFPLAPGFADPVIFKWEGKWYFLATNDNTDDVGMFVREADTVDGLFSDNTEVHCILPYDEERELCQTFWAPEFHVLGGELYILFAVSGKQWGPQCHMMKLKKGGSIINASDWENPVKVVKKDKTPISLGNISLDMTVIKTTGKTYVCWSHREHIGTPLDSGSMLYIATIDERRPWELTCEPVLLSRPLYGWENNSGTINNEGPYALYMNEKIYLAYSGGAANGYYYVVGYLVADKNADLLDVNNWTKLSMPVMHSLSVPGIQGPGHNSFFVNDEGELMIAYHAQERDKYNCRCSAYHHVHVSPDGFPYLNVVDELDVDTSLRKVTLELSVKNI